MKGFSWWNKWAVADADHLEGAHHPHPPFARNLPSNDSKTHYLRSKIHEFESFDEVLHVYEMYRLGVEDLPESQVMSWSLTFSSRAPSRSGGLWQVGSGDQEPSFSCKVLDLMNLRKRINWQSHRNGFLSIALQYKTCVKCVNIHILFGIIHYRWSVCWKKESVSWLHLLNKEYPCTRTLSYAYYMMIL
jgi:hypothetical protein